MATNLTIASDTAPNLSSSLIRVLSLPWLDRTIAAIACIPLAYLAYYRYEHWHHGLPLIMSAVGTLILVGTMMIRRPPKRVTPNPWYWLLAFVATYWQLLVLSLLQQGRPIVADWITNWIAILGLLVVIWARFSLGRNSASCPRSVNSSTAAPTPTCATPFTPAVCSPRSPSRSAPSVPRTPCYLASACFGSSRSRAWSKKTFCEPTHNTPTTCAKCALGGSRSCSERIPRQKTLLSK